MAETKTPRSWLREPLLHFLLLGAVVFAVDYALAGREDAAGLITVSAKVDDELRQIFRDARARDPDAQELQVLRQRWIDNEVLYREGIALRLDQGDSAIRDRVIFKALNVVQSNLQLPAIDDDGLRAWFEQNRAKYDQPQRIDFLEAVTAGAPDRPTLQAFADALNSGAQTQTQSGLRVFKGRPWPSIAESFGEPFARALEAAPLGHWQLLDSAEGVRVVQVQARIPAMPAEFDGLRSAVLQDWRDRRMQELRTDAVRELAKKYVVRVVSDEATVSAALPSSAKP